MLSTDNEIEANGGRARLGGLYSRFAKSQKKADDECENDAAGLSSDKAHELLLIR
jgi:hypothetical protein